MPYCYLRLLTCAVWLASALFPGTSSAAEDLPSGSSSSFRDKMIVWAMPGPEEIATPVSAAPRVRESEPLPRLSSRFGYRQHPLLGKRALHAGIDIPGPQGTPVQASEGGVVSFAGRAGGYGNMVEVDHGAGLKTRYAHLSRILVRPGATVARGETIARMGSTGRSTGSHLHFEIRVQGQAADPLDYLGRASAASPAARPAVRSPETHLSQFARARIASGQVQGIGF